MKVRFLYLLLVSAFGPYISMSMGIRFDHAMVYFLLIIFFTTNSISTKNHYIFLTPLSILILLFITPFVGLVLYDNSISYALTLSQIDNYFQPLVVVIICFSALNKLNYQNINKTFRIFLTIFIVFMAIHTLASISMYLFPKLLFWRHFTGAGLIAISEDTARIGLTAAELARIGGRISGIFTQVFEAGYAYSIALISWAYLNNKYRKFMLFQNIALVLLIIGGLLVSSKVFLVFGLSLFIYCFEKKIRLILFGILGYFSIALALFLFNINFEFIAKPIKYLNRLVDVDRLNILEVFTGNRFSSDSSITIGINEILQNFPIIGKGYGSIQTSDFSLYEVITLSGIIGVALYLFLFLFFIFLLFIIKDRLDRKYYLSIIILTVFSSLAAPTITANRISIFFWIIWSFMATIAFFQSKLIK